MYFVKNRNEMVEGARIEAVSIPFTSGVMAAAFLLPGGEGDIYWWAALVGSICLGASYALFCAKGQRLQAGILLYFSLGILAYSAASLRGSSSLPPSQILSKLSSFIDSIGFSGDHTAELLKAFLTGRREGLGSTITKNFRESGASHLLALSGLHLGIVYGVITRMLWVLGRSRGATVTRSVIAVAAASAFTIITGASPSTVRALLFIILNEASRLQPGRKRSHIGTYCASITIQLAINPLSINSTGFQLSYLAMLGIFLLYPGMEAWYPKGAGFDPIEKIWTSMALSISCQAFTAPLVWLRFRTFPTYFLLTNLLALPLTTAMMVCGLATMALHAVGIDCTIAKSLTDTLGQALLYCLNVISGISPP